MTQKQASLIEALKEHNIVWFYVRGLEHQNAPDCLGPYDIDMVNGRCKCGCMGKYFKSKWFRKLKGELTSIVRQAADNLAIIEAASLFENSVVSGSVRQPVMIKRRSDGAILKFEIGGKAFQVFSLKEKSVPQN